MKIKKSFYAAIIKISDFDFRITEPDYISIGIEEEEKGIKSIFPNASYWVKASTREECQEKIWNAAFRRAWTS